MRLTVRLFAVLRERAGTGELVLDGLPDVLDLASLKAEIEARHPELGDLTYVAGVVGDRYVSAGTQVKEGDAVALLPPVSGGSPAAGSGPDYQAGHFELSAEPLDANDAGRRVGDKTCGAVVVFTGTTRDTNRGQSVVGLEYEAFHEMAGAEMARIFADCRDVHAEPLRMLCIHRVGTVGVGEPSVVIAAASPHRDAAFRAARFLIDTLKERLPVWKKEVYADGHHWIGDRS